MKTLVISDIHNRIYWIEALIEFINPDKVIFLGDYFDNFQDNINEAIDTAKWLKRSLRYKNRIHLLGNHDAAYRYSGNNYISSCPGFTRAKSFAINSILDQECWGKIKIFHLENNILYSHAGVSANTLEYFGLNFDINIQKWEDQAHIAADKCIFHWVWAMGSRMNKPYPGGPLWEDIRYFRGIDINQIAGHSILPHPIILRNQKTEKLVDDSSFDLSEEKLNIFFDTNNKHIVLIENNTINIVKNCLCRI
ncbi:MAG: metallophosphoesterase [Richelia sp. RM2_1_2]|nr:metallophosphoesterase [Richelia sp. RM2_1_2]